MKTRLLSLLLNFVILTVQSQTILGIDVSNYQGVINWSNVKSSGKVFAFVKATEGFTFNDQRFTNNIINGQNAGVIMGAYHFARPDNNSAIDEANHFISIAGSYIGSGYLPPALDLEDVEGKTPFSTLFTSNELSNWVKTWLDKVSSDLGVDPIIYTTAFYAGYLNSNIINTTKYKLWIANPNTSPTSPPNNIGIWNNWIFKQYSWTGSVSGINGDVDLNVFNGNLNAFNSLINNSSCSAPSNDNCSTATSITSNGSCLNGTVACATSSYGANNCGNGTSIDDNDVYYKFTAQATAHTVSLSGYSSDFDAVIELRKACASGSSNFISCYDPINKPSTVSYTWSDLTIGTTYYVRVYEFNYSGTPPSTDGFTICITHSGSSTCNTPQNLVVDDIGEDFADLNWSSVSGIENYGLRYRILGNSTWTYESSTSSSLKVSGLTCNTTYEWQIRSECSSNNSNYSTTQTFTTNPCQDFCTAPTGTNGSATGQTSAIVNWDNMSPDYYYTYRYRVKNSTTWTEVNTNNTDATINNLICNTSYQWQVRTNCAVASEFSTIKEFTTGACTLTCNAASNVLVSNSTATSTLVNWVAPTGTTNTYLRWKKVTETAYSQKDVSNVNSYTITGLDCASNYELYLVSNCTSGGTQSTNNLQFSTTSCACNPPSQPGNITGTTTVCSGTSQSYSIIAVSGATDYLWSYSGGGTINSSGTSVTFSPSSNGTLSVIARNECGNSIASTKSITVSSTPTVSAINGSSNVCIGANITLTSATSGGIWSCIPPSIATISSNGIVTGISTGNATIGYTVTNSGCSKTVNKTIAVNNNTATISLSSGSGTNNQTTCIGLPITSISYLIAGGGTSAAVTGLPPGVTGSFSTGVFTINGTPSTTGSFNYKVTTSGACNNVVSNGVINSISAPPSATLSQKRDSISSSISISGSTYTWFLNGTQLTQTSVPYLKITTTGNYTVQISLSGCSSISSPLFVTSITSIVNTISSINLFNLYPNPASNTANIIIDGIKNEELFLNVLDINGKVLQSQMIQLTNGKTLVTIDVSHLTKGVYIVQLYNKDGIITEKLVVE